MRKPAFCICENKDADQMRSNCTADQHLCFLYMDSTIPLLNPKFQASFAITTVMILQFWTEVLANMTNAGQGLYCSDPSASFGCIILR